MLNLTLSNNKAGNFKFGFFIAAEILILGFILEVIYPNDFINLFIWPLNLFILIGFVSLLTLIHLLFGEFIFVRWLSSIPAAISSLVLFGFLSLLLGFVPQNSSDAPFIVHTLGLANIKSSWMFVLALLYLLSSLWLVILRRINSMKLRNIGFLLNHAGLWIALAGGILGAGDLQRIRLDLYENAKGTNIAYDTQGKQCILPFMVKLVDFNILEYPPAMFLFNYKTNRIIEDRATGELVIDIHKHYKLNKFEITPINFLYSAKKDSNGYVPDTNTFSFQAAHIRAINLLTKDTIFGWISNAGHSEEMQPLILDDTYALIMSSPNPHEYSSLIEIYDGKSLFRKDTLKVNKPIACLGWKLYQLSYDTKSGRNSKLSIIEAVRDPWLPMVYVGIFMMMAGGVYLFAYGRNLFNLRK
jgi:hypothetical protein